MRLPATALFLALAASPDARAAQDALITGEVYADVNRNGQRDPDEAGIAGVGLSNGRVLVRSGVDGRYAIAARPGDTVFAIKPGAYAFPTGAEGLPAFWIHYLPDGSPPLEYGGIAAQGDTRFDLGLLPVERTAGPLDVVLFADPQTASLVDVDYYARDIVASVRGSGHDNAQLGLTLGDVVNDDLALYPALNRATASLGVPWLHAAGNHDLDFDAPGDEQSLLTFRRHFGPDTFAWEEPGATFVVVDDVVYQPGAAPGYVGGLRDGQFAFLEAYLPTAPRRSRPSRVSRSTASSR